MFHLFEGQKVIPFVQLSTIICTYVQVKIIW